MCDVFVYAALSVLQSYYTEPSIQQKVLGLLVGVGAYVVLLNVVNLLLYFYVPRNFMSLFL